MLRRLFRCKPKRDPLAFMPIPTSVRFYRFNRFTREMTKQISDSLGVPYELLIGDGKREYSSAREAFMEAQKHGAWVAPGHQLTNTEEKSP